MDKSFGDLKGFFKDRKIKVTHRIVNVDNFIFRLHYRITIVILIAFSIAVTSRQYVGDPIDCISKDDIPNELLDTYCWIHTTFSVEDAWRKEVGVDVPYPGVQKYTKGEKRVYHAYYQWVCFVLFLQALLFYVPRYLWKNTEHNKIENLVMEFGSPIESWDKGKEEKEENDEKKEKKKTKSELLVAYMIENMSYHTFYGTMFLIAEILNFVNVVGQIYLMDTFLGGEFTTYGTEVLSFTEWDYSLRYDPMIKVFPRMTKCTFHRYGSSGDVQKHDAMCLIPINILNEKIYIFLWFWFIILTVLSALQLVYRAATIFVPKIRYYCLKARCPVVDPYHLNTVLSHCDRNDYFVLNLLSKNMSSFNFKKLIHDLSVELTTQKNV